MPPLVYSILFLVFLWAGTRWFERSMLYYPDRTLAEDPGAYGIPYHDVWMLAQDGPRLHGWFIEGRADRQVLLFFHGNAGNISHRIQKLSLLRGLGASLFIFDYRGYGLSSGRPTERGTYRDAEAAFQYLTQSRGISPRQLIFFGESLGCAIATELALRHPPQALILESPFTSIVEMGRRLFPHVPVSWIVRFRYDSLSKIPRLGSPLLILHSPQDEIVPFEMGRRLLAAAPEPKELVPLSGDHNSGFLTAGPDYTNGIAQFLDRYAVGPKARAP